MNAAATESESFTWTKILVDLTWVWDPPKVLGDCFEAIIGAVFVDCGFRLEPVFEVLDRIYKEVMPLLKDVETRDPTSRLLMLAQAKHCTKIINK
jgi:endoribonuclease Dicer